MLQILQGCFPRSEELRIFSMLRLQYVLLVFYEAHKRQKAGLKILPILSFSLRLCLSKFANVSSQF